MYANLNYHILAVEIKCRHNRGYRITMWCRLGYSRAES